MGDFLAVPAAVSAFAATSNAAGDTVISAASADSEAMNASLAAALGPIGAVYLAAHVPAQANCLTAALQVGAVYHGSACATEAFNASTIAADNA